MGLGPELGPLLAPITNPRTNTWICFGWDMVL